MVRVVMRTRKLLLSAALVMAGWSVAQDVGRAVFPTTELIWELLGGVATVEIEVHSPDVRSVRFVMMHEGELVMSGSEDVEAESRPVVTLSAGALDPVVLESRCDSGVRAFMYHREVRENGGGSGMTQRCVPVEGKVGVSSRFDATPLNRPPESYVDEPLSLPVDMWLLFGTTELSALGEPPEEELGAHLTHYFLLSTDPTTPPEQDWELPTYTTWREAVDAFGLGR